MGIGDMDRIITEKDENWEEGLPFYGNGLIDYGEEMNGCACQLVLTRSVLLTGRDVRCNYRVRFNDILNNFSSFFIHKKPDGYYKHIDLTQ